MVLGKKSFLVFGFTERTGYTVSEFLLRNNCEVYVADKARDQEKEKLLKKLKEKYPEKVFDLLGNNNPPIDSIECLIPSPGVPLTLPVFQEAKRKGIPVIGDVELIYLLKPYSKYIAITGTDGKTTTTKLTYQIIKNYFSNTVICGNIGVPVFSVFDEIDENTNVVLEISSFQIDITERFSPLVGVITNVAKDHMDRYSSMEEYVNSKFRLLERQNDGQISIINYSVYDKYPDKVKNLKSRKIIFSAYERKNLDCFLEGNWIYCLGRKLLDTSKVKLIGKHNYENIMVSSAIALILGVPEESIKNSVYNFLPLAHRMEFVREINGVVFINDSKATTMNATASAIMSLEKPIVLIVGGYDKGVSFEDLVEYIKRKVKYVITIGQTREKIFKILVNSGYKAVEIASSLEEAIIKSLNRAKKGDVVLFSPAYASFDMFQNYEERGSKFKEIVNNI